MGDGLKRLVFFLLVVFWVSCKQYPKDVLPPDKMKYIFYDMMLADEFQNYFAGRDTIFNLDSIRAQNYLDILKLHNIDSNAFKKSLEFYNADVEEFAVLIDSVFQYAGRERDKRFQMEAAAADSLTNATDSLGN